MPPQYKAGTAAICGSVNWLCCFVVTMIFPILQESIDEYSFCVFIGVMVLAILYIIFKMPESKGKTIEEMQEIFANKTGCL